MLAMPVQRNASWKQKIEKKKKGEEERGRTARNTKAPSSFSIVCVGEYWAGFAEALLTSTIRCLQVKAAHCNGKDHMIKKIPNTRWMNQMANSSYHDQTLQYMLQKIVH